MIWVDKRMCVQDNRESDENGPSPNGAGRGGGTEVKAFWAKKVYGSAGGVAMLGFDITAKKR